MIKQLSGSYSENWCFSAFCKEQTEVVKYNSRVPNLLLFGFFKTKESIYYSICLGVITVITFCHNITNIAQATHCREIANMVPLQVLNFHACHLWQFVEIYLNHQQDGMVMILRGYQKTGTYCLNLSICSEYLGLMIYLRELVFVIVQLILVYWKIKHKK